jgi:hypothetical protein
MADGTGRDFSDAAVAEPLARTLQWLIDVAPELARDQVRYLFSVVESLRQFEDELFDVFRASAEANFIRSARLTLRGEEFDVTSVPMETLDFVRQLARRGVPVDDVLHALREGYAVFWKRVADRLILEADGDSGVLVTKWTERYLRHTNWLARATTDIYTEERKRWARSANALRIHTVDQILRGHPLDVDNASKSLTYELRRRHIAVIAWTDSIADADETLKRLESAVAGAARAVGYATPLVVNDGISACWAWFSPQPGFDDSDVGNEPAVGGVRLAVGRCASGLDGFRASHVDAVEARRVARLADRPVAVTRFRTVELSSLMTADLDRARDFVHGRLGPIATSDPANEPLRETLLAYLESGNSKLVAASELAVHHHTVSNRLRRIEELLETPLRTSSLIEIHAALVLARDLGSQVLRDPPSSGT